MPNPAGSGLPNEASYTDMGETVIDDVTCLEWQKVAPDTVFNWDEAVEYCDALDLAGRSDWRLPTRIELLSIYLPEQGIDETVFGGRFNHNWSSSPEPKAIHDPHENPGLNSSFTVFARGVYLSQQRLNNVARCVRGGGTGEGPLELAVAPPNLYSEIAPGEIRDNYTGLVWQQDQSKERMRHDGAAAYCSELALGGHDWRVPTPQELSTLVDEAIWPAISINVEVFPDTKYDLQEYPPYWATQVLSGVAEGFGYGLRFFGGTFQDLNGASEHFRDEGWVKCVR